MREHVCVYISIINVCVIVCACVHISYIIYLLAIISYPSIRWCDKKKIQLFFGKSTIFADLFGNPHVILTSYTCAFACACSVLFKAPNNAEG